MDKMIKFIFTLVVWITPVGLILLIEKIGKWAKRKQKEKPFVPPMNEKIQMGERVVVNLKNRDHKIIKSYDSKRKKRRWRC